MNRFNDDQWYQLAKKVDDPMIAGRVITEEEALNAEQQYSVDKSAYRLGLHPTREQEDRAYEQTRRNVDTYHNRLREMRAAQDRVRRQQNR